MKKKVFLGLFLILILVANISFASYSTVKLEVVEEPICTIELGANSKFEKKLIEKDLTNKEVTLQLQVTNGEEAKKPTGEIMLVLDNSDSMNSDVADGKTRKDLIFNSAKTLVSNLLKDNENLKIGIVSFSSNVEPSEEATLADANVVSPLSDNATSLTNAISTIVADGPRTDLDAGITLASEQFTETDSNKYMIILTDGVPNIALDYDNIYYSDDVINKTKSKLQSLDTSGIDIITMLTGISEDEKDKVPPTVSKTYGQIIEEIFGTAEEPTVGNFYYVTDDKIEETITEDIYNSLLPIIQAYTDVTIDDYFPTEIIDNFEFSYVSESNIGTISSEINKENNSITWKIPSLANGETATIQYKLKLKENFSSEIVDKILSTNQKVDITYKDFDNIEHTKASDVSPKLKLTEPPVVLPEAGITTIIFTFLAVLSVGLLIFSLVKLSVINKFVK